MQKTTKHSQRDVKVGGDPCSQRVGVAMLRSINQLRREFCRKYKLRSEGLELLVHITVCWKENSTASNIRSLSRLQGTQVTSVHLQLERMMERGLVEIVGRKGVARYFAPTRLAIRELRTICNDL